MKTSFVFRRRLQDVLPKHYENVFKMSIRNVSNASSRRVQDVFKTPSRRLTRKSCKNEVFEDVLQKCLGDLFKMSSRHLLDVLQRCLKDILKRYHRVKPLLLTRFQDVFKTYSKMVIYRRICLCQTF